MTTTEIAGWTAAAGAAGTLLAGWVMKALGFLDSRRDKFVTELKKTIDEVKVELAEEKKECERRISARESIVDHLRGEVESLRSQVLVLSTAGDVADPIPRWMSREGVFVWANRAMEREILKPLGLRLADIQGKKAGEVFPVAFAETLAGLAKEVLASPDGEACLVNVQITDGSANRYMVRSQTCESQGFVFGHIGIAMRQPHAFDVK